MAGTVHDLGKINVPADILNKPGRLGAMEMAIVRQHPETAFDILKTIEFPWPVADIVNQHHEREDGSGYPLGLTAAYILPEAKILAVADVVEAMASHRPYRPALGLAMALEEIKSNRDRLYNAEVVDACLRLFEKGYNLQAD
jgi:putative two-component system response regulator